MDKQDFLQLIEAYTAVTKLNQITNLLAGTTIEDGELSGLSLISSILLRNSKFRRTGLDEDFTEADQRLEDFASILDNDRLSPEEKYLLLVD